MDLDRLYLPHWQFSEHHQRLIDAPAAAVLDAVEDLRTGAQFNVSSAHLAGALCARLSSP